MGLVSDNMPARRHEALRKAGPAPRLLRLRGPEGPRELTGILSCLDSCETMEDALANARDFLAAVEKRPEAVREELAGIVSDIREALDEATASG